MEPSLVQAAILPVASFHGKRCRSTSLRKENSTFPRFFDPLIQYYIFTKKIPFLTLQSAFLAAMTLNRPKFC